MIKFGTFDFDSGDTIYLWNQYDYEPDEAAENIFIDEKDLMTILCQDGIPEKIDYIKPDIVEGSSKYYNVDFLNAVIDIKENPYFAEIYTMIYQLRFYSKKISKN